MFCEKCGSQVPDGQSTCPNCGAAFSADSQQNPSEQPTEQYGAPLPPPEFGGQQGAVPAPPQGYAPPQPAAPVSAAAVVPPAAAPVGQTPAPAVPNEPIVAPVTPDQTAAIPQQPVPAPVPMPGQVPDQVPVFNQAGYPQPAPVNAPQKKKNWKPLIIGIAAALVVLLGIGIFVGVSAFQENQRSEAYAAAMAMMDDRQFQIAYDRFTELGDYQDSADKAAWCQKGIDYEAAMEMKGDGQYEDAIEAFSTLGSFEDSADQVENCKAWISLGEANELTDAGQFQEAADMSGSFAYNLEVGYSDEYYQWHAKNYYGLADLKFQAGDFYGAYEDFLMISSYEDAAVRAEACKQPFPGNSEFYHHEGFISSTTEVVFDGATSLSPYYIKVYSGETLVSTLFVNAGGSTTISLIPGSYTFKDATGDMWFGEGGMFGDDGHYSTMLFDGESEVVNLDSNMIYTITLYVAGGDGNVGGRSGDREGF